MFDVDRAVALDIAALRTCVSAGLIPHARHGGKGVCALAVAGSKFDGTGFEKLQMMQTQVAVLAGGGSDVGGRRGLSDRGRGDALPLLDGVDASAGDRGCRDERFVVLGISVTFADDLRNPAWNEFC